MNYPFSLCRQFLLRCAGVVLGIALLTPVTAIAGCYDDPKDRCSGNVIGTLDYYSNNDVARTCADMGGGCVEEHYWYQSDYGQNISQGKDFWCYSGSPISGQNINQDGSGNFETWTSYSSCLAPSCAQSTQDRTSTACPGGQTGTITERQTLNQGGVCGSNSGWVQISNTCAASYTYYWSAGGFNGWSACDNGQQHRERGVWCYRSDGTMMDPDQSQCYATAGPKPQWQEFQSCNAGYATDTQPFVCKRADGVVVPESYCAGQGRPADNTRQGQVCMSSCTASTEDRTSTPCPAGQTGTITERRTLNQGGVCGSNSGWGEIGRTCQAAVSACVRSPYSLTRTLAGRVDPDEPPIVYSSSTGMFYYAAPYNATGADMPCGRILEGTVTIVSNGVPHQVSATCTGSSASPGCDGVNNVTIDGVLYQVGVRVSSYLYVDRTCRVTVAVSPGNLSQPGLGGC